MSNSGLIQVTVMGSSFRSCVQRWSPHSQHRMTSQWKPLATLKEKNIGKKEGVDRKKSGQAGRQAGRLTGLRPWLEIWPAFGLFSASCWKGNSLEPSSHQSKGMAFHSLLHRNKPAFSPSWGGRAFVVLQQRGWSFFLTSPEQLVVSFQPSPSNPYRKFLGTN